MRLPPGDGGKLRKAETECWVYCTPRGGLSQAGPFRSFHGPGGLICASESTHAFPLHTQPVFFDSDELAHAGKMSRHELSGNSHDLEDRL